ncbi:MAG: short-chain dehydrogenase, partial [Dehalococcoidia bacterium]|nr:short-chain dehydrogenase [Dehalococcoidia bacterium]
CPGPVQTEFHDVARIDEGRVPRAAWTSVDAVVESALSAMRGGRAIAIPGVLNRAGAVSSRLVPRFVTRRIAGAMFRDQGPHKDG